MSVATDQLFIILVDEDSEEPNSFRFCINRPIDELALIINDLDDVDGVMGFIGAERGYDDSTSDSQTFVTIAFQPNREMPGIFGRIAIHFAQQLGMEMYDTLLCREVSLADLTADLSQMEFMRLTDYCMQFPSTVYPNVRSGSPFTNEVLRELGVLDSEIKAG